MARHEDEISAWIRKAVAIEDGRSPDRLEILVRGAGKSWPQHADVRCADRPPDAVVTEVLEHVADIIDSAKEEGRSTWSIRLRRYVNGSPSGSRTFGSAAGAPAGSDSSPADADDLRAESVATIRELRMLVGDFGNRIMQSGSDGWRMSIELSKEVGKLRQENAELSIALGLADNDKQTAVKQLTEAALPMLPQLLTAVVAKLSEK